MASQTIFFNDLCVEDAVQSSTQNSWIEGLATFSNAIKQVLLLKGNLKIGFHQNAINAQIHGKSLWDHFRNGLQKEAYVLMLKNVEYLDDSQLLSDVKVSFDLRVSSGISHTVESIRSTAFGCAISISLGELWSAESLNVNCEELDDDRVNIKKSSIVDVAHISSEKHIHRWRDDIMNWGYQIAKSWKIHEFNGMPVVMYPGPKEHPPAHVHLLENNGSGRTVAKYLVEVFERAKGPPTWDGYMKHFIDSNRETLLHSWELCQKGKKPIEI
jgi:hypothetical protein